MRSCLEIKSMDARHTMETRSDYTRVNEYHNNYEGGHAKDLSEKGTGHGGHGHWLPNCKGTIGQFDYSNFDTDYRSKAGNIADNKARETVMTRSLYSYTYRYDLEGVDTTMNQKEGQFVLP